MSRARHVLHPRRVLGFARLASFSIASRVVPTSFASTYPTIVCPRDTLQHSHTIDIILPVGTITLAMKMTAAIGYDP